MGRQRTIDREKLLETIFDIVMEQGAAALTIDTVAKRMGISKGGVQYCFSSKEAMIDAMFEHWEESYETKFKEVIKNDDSSENRVAAHIYATQAHDQISFAKGASLLAALLQTPEYLQSTKAWYQQRLTGIDTTTEAGKRARLAFLATEGTFLLRYLGLMDINDNEWQSIFEDIDSVLLQQGKRE
ncbi:MULTISPECIES: TetR/AcrR family transcriptional regulator [Enterobacterales]|uniref:TetR/AcrR family transcriptional regulator n=1 Tax=Enterobacterales TaxID=91347 RepID=UPI00084829D6|nr:MULTISPECIES: TetR/AcrR family transcriptional regulator [Enterobacterales]WOO49698.1 TetR/AcrR family transcriptional regulator [Hafnia alvei]ODQ03851.1 TetR family transcriptional regulator [Shigella sp. FC130]OEI91536.1 TetR family transcriptional regulator [Shigella sp. FC1655]OEJ08986.1 TetR family transcriptional regulator [Shigella sp. FC1967]WPF04162.1 TetR/AcrR family transcriptional regulator [Proteus vulgaris]